MLRREMDGHLDVEEAHDGSHDLRSWAAEQGNVGINKTGRANCIGEGR